MRIRLLLLLALAPPAAAAASEQTTVTGDVLLIERVQASAALQLPARGMSMAQVEARFGTPAQKMEPRGGQKPQWPVIHRWNYPQFTVYFERDRVINAVANQATPEEIGPKPVR